MTDTLLNRRQAVVALALGTSLARAADPVKLKLSSFEPPMANITANVLAPFARDASARSAGTLQIDVFAGGTLGRNPAQQLKLVTDGIADIAWVVLPYTPGRFDDTEVVGLPFVTRNASAASLALQRLHAAGALAGFDGLKVLALAATPPVAIHANRPVRLPDDLKGRRVRVSGAHLVHVVEALGGAPVQVGGAQIAEAMSRGVVDMTLNNWGFVGDFKVDEVSTHHLDVPLGAVPVAVVMRQDRYDALPAAARAALDQAGGEALARRLGEAFDRQEQEVRERISRSGRNHVVAPTAEEAAQWRRRMEPLNDEWRKARARNEAVHRAFVAELGRA